MKNNEVVVITGASAGVGRATAREFAQRGAYIGLIARDRDRLEKTRGEVEAAGGKAIVLQADVADAESVFRMADRVADEFGRIDVWINCAMTTTADRLDPDRPDNLYRPVPGNFGAHGEFDKQAHEKSAQFWLTTRRPWLLGAGGILAGFLLGTFFLGKRR